MNSGGFGVCFRAQVCLESALAERPLSHLSLWPFSANLFVYLFVRAPSPSTSNEFLRCENLPVSSTRFPPLSEKFVRLEATAESNSKHFRCQYHRHRRQHHLLIQKKDTDISVVEAATAEVIPEFNRKYFAKAVPTEPLELQN